MRPLARLTLAALAALLMTEPCAALTCGENITDAQTLTADLVCTTGTGLLIRDGGSLDMNGFALRCDTSMTNGIELIGKGSSLSNGAVIGCSIGVLVNGNKEKIRNVVASDGSTGFSIVNVDNQVQDCAAVGNDNRGFYVGAPRNSLSGIVARGNGGAGVTIFGTDSKLSDLTISGGGTNVPGIELSGQDNQIRKARIAGASIGVYVSGTSNQISEITSLNHTDAGMQVFGSTNQVKNSVAIAAASANTGFVLYGTGNSISGCRSTGSKVGISSTGSQQAVSSNKVFGSAETGVFVTGSENVIKKNFAIGSGTVDLHEDVAGCANGDVWTKNVGSRNDACIE